MPQKKTTIRLPNLPWIHLLAVFFFCGFLGFAQEASREERILSTAIKNALHPHEGLAGCGILLASRTGETLAQFGDIDRYRDPGSTLKPFIYAEALQRGLLIPQTVLEDKPYQINGHDVQNYDGKYHGSVTATFALTQSLNIPAVKVLVEGIGTENFQSILKEIGILEPKDQSPFPGYRVAMGGIPVTPAILAKSYAKLYQNDFSRWSNGVTVMLLNMMRTIPLPHATQIRASWKSGTSQGNRDAWCLAVTPEYTLCIWFGYEDFASAPFLEGRSLSAPVAGAILTALYQEKSPDWPATPPSIVPCELCAISGLTPTADCRQRTLGQKLDEIDLRKCNLCGEDGTRNIRLDEEE